MKGPEDCQCPALRIWKPAILVLCQHLLPNSAKHGRNINIQPFEGPAGVLGTACSVISLMPRTLMQGNTHSNVIPVRIRLQLDGLQRGCRLAP